MRLELSTLLGLVCAVLQPLSAAAEADGSTGFVYVATNQPSGNQIVQYSIDRSGSLTQVGSPVATLGNGGTGNGVGNLDPLGSQDSLILSDTGSFLVVVNAGSNTLSSMRAGSGGVAFISMQPSNGSFPNSVALRGSLAYVLNAHTSNISGYRLSSGGALTAIANSTTPLPNGGTAKPHDIRFSPDGTRLLVTDEGNNQIDIFELNDNGLVSGVATQPSVGMGPFGFKFGRDGALVVAEAGSGSASSYFLTSQNTLQVISPEVRNGQMATCWISLTGSGKFGFTSNTGSGTLSAYQIAGNGTLNLADAVAAAVAGSAPIDSAFSSDSAFLYAVDSAIGRILEFEVHGASLHFLGAVTGLPQTVQGIAAQ